jgi:hypothetical protein
MTRRIQIWNGTELVWVDDPNPAPIRPDWTVGVPADSPCLKARMERVGLVVEEPVEKVEPKQLGFSNMMLHPTFRNQGR